MLRRSIRLLLVVGLMGCVRSAPIPQSLDEMSRLDAYLAHAGFQRQQEWSRADFDPVNNSTGWNLQGSPHRCLLLVVLATGEAQLQRGAELPVTSRHPWVTVCGSQTTLVLLTATEPVMVAIYDGGGTPPDLNAYFVAGSPSMHAAPAAPVPAVVAPLPATPDEPAPTVTHREVPSEDRAPPSAESSEDAARRHFRSGMEHTEVRAWDAAIRAFENSLELVWRVSTAMNLAAAYAEKTRFADAYTMYRRVLPDTRGPRRRVVRRSMRRLRRSIAIVTVRCVEGATVQIGETSLDCPGDAVMPPGIYGVTIRRGETTLEQPDLELQAGERRTLDLSEPSEPSEPTELSE